MFSRGFTHIWIYLGPFAECLVLGDRTTTKSGAYWRKQQWKYAPICDSGTHIQTSDEL